MKIPIKSLIFSDSFNFEENRHQDAKMKKNYPVTFFSIVVLLLYACHTPDREKKKGDIESLFREGEFGYDLSFLKKKDSSLILLRNGDAQIIVSPKYQAKVFTSTASGEHGPSFGWINYKAFGDSLNVHMNAYGGENRIWLGPEGGKYSLFFKPGAPMVFENWKTPLAFDTEGWELRSSNDSIVVLSKNAILKNYAGSELNIVIGRSIKILDNTEISNRMGMAVPDSIQVVGYETTNELTNNGNKEWTSSTGMPCIWILDMLRPSSSTVIVVPFRDSSAGFQKAVTSNYFGDISPDRLRHNDHILFFKADGNSRGKLGIAPAYAVPKACSYDPQHQVLTVILFDLDARSSYLNQQWNTKMPPFSGDVVNAYNDGPLADGSRMGPFYELESVSPAAFLKPGSMLVHNHSVFHFSGNEKYLDKISEKLFGISLKNIAGAF
jgi:hypothetical protein